MISHPMNVCVWTDVHVHDASAVLNVHMHSGIECTYVHVHCAWFKCTQTFVNGPKQKKLHISALPLRQLSQPSSKSPVYIVKQYVHVHYYTCVCIKTCTSACIYTVWLFQCVAIMFIFMYIHMDSVHLHVHCTCNVHCVPTHIPIHVHVHVLLLVFMFKSFYSVYIVLQWCRESEVLPAPQYLYCKKVSVHYVWGGVADMLIEVHKFGILDPLPCFSRPVIHNACVLHMKSQCTCTWCTCV